MSLCKMLPLWIFACVGIGALVGGFVIHDLWAGVNIGMMIGFLPMLVFGLLVLVMLLVDREYPDCRCGRGKRGDYEYLRHSLDGPGQFEYRCRGCGRLYRYRKAVFYELTGEGDEVPYMRKMRFRWKPLPETWRELVSGGEG